MNTTDYFTYVNAMFLFCIFTCGLLVWAVIRGYILKGKLLKEQDSHLKATNTNTLLNKALSAKNAGLQANEHKLREAEKEIRELQAKLTESEKQANGYKAEFIAVSNELEATKAKVRKRDANGKFLPSGNARPKRVNKVKSESPKLVHGLTVKNPTEDEAKMIFDEARRFGLRIHAEERLEAELPNIWFTPNDTVSRCIIGSSQRQYVTAKEFVQRMQNGRG